MERKIVKKVKVGIVLEKYIDEDYIRDRDIVIPLFEGETEKDAISLWCNEMKSWIKPNEKRYVKVIKEVGLNEYGGYELYRE